jgi:hypothetical protein
MKGALKAVFVSVACMTVVAFAQESLKSREPGSTMIPKSASTDSLGARATVSPSATVYGGFGLSAQTTVYIMVRGPSLTTLGVTPNSLDAPWVRLYNANGADLVTTGATPGFMGCAGTSSSDTPVVNFYTTVRREPPNSRDSCLAATLSAGTYTFSVTPSIPGSTSPAGISSSRATGEILFEVTLGPASSETPNRAASLRLVGGTWTYTYTIITTFSDRYTFTRVDTTPSSSGTYFAEGRDAFGNIVAGGYDPRLGMWAVLDPGTLIDQFYTFTFNSDNSVSGCYYQIQPAGSANLSRCYSMVGTRTGGTLNLSLGEPSETDRAFEVARDTMTRSSDPAVLEAYLAQRQRLQ